MNVKDFVRKQPTDEILDHHTHYCNTSTASGH